MEFEFNTWPLVKDGSLVHSRFAGPYFIVYHFSLSFGWFTKVSVTVIVVDVPFLMNDTSKKSLTAAITKGSIV